MGDYDIGTARGRIVITASQLGRTTAALDNISNKLLLIGGAAAAGIGYAISKSAEFEQQLSRFQAVANAPESAMERIRKKAIQLGQDSAYGATEVIKAFAELGYAGASTEEIISGLGDATVYLAAAAETDLKDAATTLINTMRQFNIPASGAVEIANELARAANASTIDIQDLVVSLKYAGPVAAAMGQSFNDVAESLAIMGNAGIRGSTAGTSLRGVMIGLLATSAPAQAAMHELGLDTNEVGNNFFDAAGKMRSLPEIAEILRGALGGLGDKVFDANGKLKSMDEINGLLADSTVSLTDKQKLQALTTIFQRRALATALVLAKDGAKAYDKLGKSAQYQTTAQQLMNKKLDNLKGSLKILKSSFETLLITLGASFQKPLKQLADKLRDLTNWFSKLDPKTQEFIAHAILVAAGVLLMLGAFLKIVSVALKTYKAFKDLALAAKLLGRVIKGGFGLVKLAKGTAKAAVGFVQLAKAIGSTSLAIVTSPIFWIVVAILAVAAAVYFLWTRWKQVWAWIKDHKAIAAVIAILNPFILFLVAMVGIFHWVYENWDDIWAWIKQAAKDTWDWIKQAWHDVEDTLGGINDVLDNVAQFFENAWKTIVKIVKTAWHVIEEIMGFMHDRFEDAVDIIAFFVKAWQFTWKLVSTIIDTAWNSVLKPTLQFIWDRLEDIKDVIDTLKDVWDSAWGTISGAVDTAWNQFIKPALESIVAIGLAPIVWAIAIVKGAWSTLSDGLQTAADIILGILQPIADLLGIISDLWDSVFGKDPEQAPGKRKEPKFGKGGTVGAAASGAVVKKAKLTWVGEKEPEAIIPLSKLKGAGPLPNDLASLWRGGKATDSGKSVAAAISSMSRTVASAVMAAAKVQQLKSVQVKVAAAPAPSARAGADPGMVARMDQQNALLRQISQRIAEVEHPVVGGDFIVQTGQIQNPLNILKYSVSELKAASWRRSVG